LFALIDQLGIEQAAPSWLAVTWSTFNAFEVVCQWESAVAGLQLLCTCQHLGRVNVFSALKHHL
jgi:hypothetical protein